jgi:hypothetical protein
MAEWPSTPAKFNIFVFLRDSFGRNISAIIPAEIAVE